MQYNNFFVLPVFLFLFELVGLRSKSSIFPGSIIGGCGIADVVELTKRCAAKRSDPDSDIRISQKGVLKVSTRVACIEISARPSVRLSRQSETCLNFK